MDVAHAFNPLFPENYEKMHKCNFGESLVIKKSSSYATDFIGHALIQELTEKINESEIEENKRKRYAVYENKNRGGSTVGTMLACQLGIRTIDIGAPIFAMHSARELSCFDDVEMLYLAVKKFYEDF